ncbi:MAG TPA: hypothetical protein PK413_17995 [Thermoanaerobaculia bacterium]|nr:hypothetical protein [Thermoanaerobaculia bacterium]
MSLASVQHYAFSCGLLLVPASLWNLALTRRLPPAFSQAGTEREIPALLVFAENALRFGVFALPFFMPLEVSAPASRRALLLYAVGTLVYFASWLPLIGFPASSWSRSALGFLAPAYTPFLWLLGIALLGQKLFWSAAYRWWMYLVLALAFLAAHITHMARVWARSR